MRKFEWSLKCWTFACQPCAQWQTQCLDIWQQEKTKSCPRWCHEKRKQKGDSKMCEWVKCQGCEGWEEKCTVEAITDISPISWFFKGDSPFCKLLQRIFQNRYADRANQP